MEDKWVIVLLDRKMQWSVIVTLVDIPNEKKNPIVVKSIFLNGMWWREEVLYDQRIAGKLLCLLF